MTVIEAGSWDIDLNTVPLRVAHVNVGNIDRFREDGIRFIVSELFQSPDGKNLDAKIFDVRTMCYGLLIAPVQKHAEIPNQTPEIRLGKLVGGGHLFYYKEAITMAGNSFKYDREPDAIRSRFSALLQPTLREKVSPDVEVNYNKDPNSLQYLSPYWLRYRQINDEVQSLDVDWAQRMRSRYRYDWSEE